MFKTSILSIVLGLMVPAAASGQSDPKAFLANKTIDFSQAHALPFQSADMTLFENVVVEGQHYAMTAAWKKSKLEPITLYPLGTVEVAERTIGGWSDWNGIAPAVTDPSGDVDVTANFPGSDLANVFLAHDDTYVYFLMTLHDADPRPGTLYVVEFQQYLTQLHTPGDVITMAHYGPDGWVASISARGPGMNTYYLSAGVVQVGDKRIGWKLPLAAVQYPPDTPLPYYAPSLLGPQGIGNRFVRAYVHPNPGENGVADSNDQLSRPLIINFQQ